MRKNSNGPALLAVIAVTSIGVLGGTLALTTSGINDSDQAKMIAEAEHTTASLLSSQLAATIEEFSIREATDTGEGYDTGDGVRRDANGNIIPRRDTQQPTTPTTPQPVTPQPGDNKITIAAKEAWQEYIAEGGRYTSASGPVTGGRHDCSGFVTYVLSVKCGIPSGAGNSSHWAVAPAGFTLIGTYTTAAEVVAAAQPGDILAYTGHVEIYMGNSTKAGWGGYGSKGPSNDTFPTNPAKVITATAPFSQSNIDHHDGKQVRLFRYTNL